MARNIFGNQKRIRVDRHTHQKYSQSDIRWEQFKIVIWLLLGYAYFHFIVMGWTI